MDHKKAKKLIKNIFEAGFDKQRFRRLVIELLNDADESAHFTYRGSTIPKSFQSYVRTINRVAKYEDDEGKLVDILIVHLKKESSLERARTMQRNLVGWYLNGSRGGVKKDAALVAFVSPDSGDWRFSLVEMDYELLEQEDGGVKPEQTFTPARRYSFLVGKNEHSHTAQQQLIPILKRDRKKPAVSELKKAFSVESVTQRFYEHYRELFLELKEELDQFVESDKTIRRDFGKHHVDTADFAKKLLGQIVFLYFLQKKGWFGVGRNDDWGSGPKHFLRELFEKKHAGYSNFFNDILEPLFYEALARKRTDNYYRFFNCKIPFLNGGLFEPIQNYDWVHTDLLLPNKLFSNEDETGILDVFDRYNFTVRENELLEIEVAVDPEMLGKVFENLLEVQDRKSKGTYYTPREIVHYMCQESLINHLETEIEGKVPVKDLEALVRLGEQWVQNDRQVEEQQIETETYNYDATNAIRNNAREIDDELAAIRICDPAVGSGAFLVGMMNEIVRKREVLTSYLPNAGRRSIYQFKKEAIHNCLYGVDIDSGAVEIAKLRLWLSLVVEEENIKRIASLPNLDYKIMQGNSLLEEYEGIQLIDERFFANRETNEHLIEQLEQQEKKQQRKYIQLHQNDELTEQKEKELNKKLKKIPKQIKEYKNQRKQNGTTSDLFSSNRAHEKAEQLLDLQDRFFNIYRREEKKELKKKIETFTWDLIELTLKEQNEQEKLNELKALREKQEYPFFLWHLHFAEVFQTNGGFDVVIGNPPYLSHDKIEYKKSLKRNYKVYEPFADLYCYFIELAKKIASKNGVVTFITSNSFIKADYGRHLRRILGKNGSIKQLLNVQESQVFKSAIVNVAILLFYPKEERKILNTLVTNAKYDNGSFKEFVDEHAFYIANNNFSETEWLLASQPILEIQNKIKNLGTTLEDLNTMIRLGLATGANYAFILDEKDKQRLISYDNKNQELIKPILRGKDINRYESNFANKYIILAKNGINIKRGYPTIFEYLDRFGERFKSRGAQGKDWWNLRACSFFSEFKKTKLVWSELTNQSCFTLTEGNIYLLNTAYFLITPNELRPKYLLGLLNSKLIKFYFTNIAATSGMGTLRWINAYVKKFPIYVTEYQDQKFVKNKVNQILQAKENGTDTRRLEQEVDQLVYELYGLTDEEIALVEESVGYQ